MPNIDVKTALLESIHITELETRYSYAEIKADYEQLKNDIIASYDRSPTDLPDSINNENLSESEQTRLMIEQQKKQMAYIAHATKEIDQELAFMEIYGDSFRYLYKIKKENPLFVREDQYRLSFAEIEQAVDNGGILNVDDHVRMSADNNDSVKQLALHVEMGEDFPAFYLTMPKSDHNEARVKAQIVMDSEDLSAFDEEGFTQSQRNEEVIKRIMRFCEAHGLSTVDFDIPYMYDGSVDGNELYDRYRRRLDEQTLKMSENFMSAFQVVKNDALSVVEQNNRNDARDREVVRSKTQEMGVDSEEVSPDRAPDRYISCAAFSPRSEQKAENKKNTQKNITSERLKSEIEDFLEKGLVKRKDLSYWRRRPLLGRWDAEYIIFDRENEDNYKNYKKNDKSGKYAFRLYVRANNDHSLDLCYMTQDSKALDENVINGLAGHLKALGITHVNFPEGLSDREKGLWRKALAEQGLIPLGIALDRAKISAMLDAAKKKLSDEEYYNYQHQLAKQVAEDYKKKEAKGKKVPISEWEYVQGQMMTYQYKNFALAYNNFLKGKITGIVHPQQESENGAVDKIAAFRNLRKTFNIFKEKVQNGADMSVEDIAALYDQTFEQSRIEAKTMLDEKFNEAGPKRADEVIKSGVFSSVYNNCKSMVKELKSLGIDGIDLPEPTSELPYDSPRNNNQPAPNNRQYDSGQSLSNGEFVRRQNENGL